MLKRFDAGCHPRGAGPQRGISMLLVLIILMAMTLAAVGLRRSTLTANAIAGNLGMQRAAASSADQGMEVAIAWLESNSGQASSTSATACATSIGSTVLACDQPGHGYLASRADPASGQGWPALWDELATLATPGALGIDEAGNGVAYLIQRMCSSQGDASGGACSAAPTSGTCGSSQTIGSNGGAGNLSCKSQVYYRITVKVSGPRNTFSYAQAMVAL